MITFLQIAGGLLFLFIGGEALVKGSVSIARNFGIPVLVIGLTIVAIGTSAPEMVVGIQAALGGHPDVAIGNIVGSNIANILLVLGLSAAIAPIIIHPEIIKQSGPFLIFITILFIIVCWSDGITVWEAVMLLLCKAAYSWYIIESTKNSKKKNELLKEIEADLPAKTNSFLSIILIIVGIIALAYGADIFVEGSVSVARFFGISEAAIGLTLVAIGTSAPEISTCVIASYRNHSDIVLGNVIGSNLVNIMVGISIPALITHIPVNQKFLETDMWVMLAATLIMMGVIIKSKKVGRKTGVLFFICYIGYIAAQL